MYTFMFRKILSKYNSCIYIKSAPGVQILVLYGPHQLGAYRNTPMTWDKYKWKLRIMLYNNTWDWISLDVSNTNNSNKISLLLK